MAYRTPDAERVAAAEASARARAELDELAAAGAEVTAAERARFVKRLNRERRADERVKGRALRGALLGNSGAFIAWILTAGVGGVGGGTLLIALAGGRAWMIGGGVALIVLGIGVGALAHVVLGPRVVAAEQRWLAGLGFSVKGYLEVLAVAPSDTSLTLTVTFRGEAPPDDTVRGLAGLAKAKATREGHAWELRSPELSTSGGDGPDSNGRLHKWLRGAVEKIVLPMHAVYPVKHVEVRRA